MPSQHGYGDAARLARAYTLNWLCHRAGRDPQLRAGPRENAAAALETLPLSEDERQQLLTGDVRALYERGVRSRPVTHRVLTGAGRPHRVETCRGRAPGRSRLGCAQDGRTSLVS
ncbi:hypothetical protein GCM10011578_049530 [Streptomyces fuscichromogenes]|uniref:Uncharacterized protein n=1 Tax=Streptomyces fuscichromogenes TaxID=1324013 RepID=A0A917XF78_9ACTN|nr:hypothetical protein GCM10011578_049530 [Streptomyces fuscichromogenes]